MARNEELEYKRIKVTTTSFYILNASHLFIIELQEITTFKLIVNDKFLWFYYTKVVSHVAYFCVYVHE
jgi:hypothetical protein